MNQNKMFDICDITRYILYFFPTFREMLIYALINKHIYAVFKDLCYDKDNDIYCVAHFALHMGFKFPNMLYCLFEHRLRKILIEKNYGSKLARAGPRFFSLIGSRALSVATLTHSNKRLVLNELTDYDVCLFPQYPQANNSHAFYTKAPIKLEVLKGMIETIFSQKWLNKYPTMWWNANKEQIKVDMETRTDGVTQLLKVYLTKKTLTFSFNIILKYMDIVDFNVNALAFSPYESIYSRSRFITKESIIQSIKKNEAIFFEPNFKGQYVDIPPNMVTELNTAFEYTNFLLSDNIEHAHMRIKSFLNKRFFKYIYVSRNIVNLVNLVNEPDYQYILSMRVADIKRIATYSPFAKPLYEQHLYNFLLPYGLILQTFNNDEAYYQFVSNEIKNELKRLIQPQRQSNLNYHYKNMLNMLNIASIILIEKIYFASHYYLYDDTIEAFIEIPPYSQLTSQ